MGQPSGIKPVSVIGAGLCITGFVLIMAFMIASMAYAQSGDQMPNPVNPASAAPAPPPKFYLEVDQTDLQAISQAINELPKRVADPLILKLNAQLSPDQQAKLKPGPQDNTGIITQGQKGDNAVVRKGK